MPKTPFLFLVLVLLAIGCEPATEKTQYSSTTKEDDRVISSASSNTVQGPILFTTQRSHEFSSRDQADFFRLDVRGKSITEGTVYFTITTRDGKVIHAESFPAADVEAAMVYEMKAPTATVTEREDYITRRLETFVENDDFVSPAIPANARPDTAFLSFTTWKQIQARPRSLGFKYLLGKEDGRLLVYDSVQQKAVRYGSFGG